MAKVDDLAVAPQNLWGLYVKLTGEVLNVDDQGTNTTWKTVNNGASPVAIRVLVEKRCMSVETFEYHDLLSRGGYALHMLQNKDPLPETD